MQLLLASDVIPLRQRLSLLLEQEGYKLILAESQSAALQAMSRQPQLDVVISEWKFSDGTLLDLQKRSQHLNYITDNGNDLFSPHWIVIATPRDGRSQAGRTSLSSEIRTFGFKDVFEKPINSLMLLERLAAIGRERSAAIAARVSPESSAAEETGLAASMSLETVNEVMSSRLAKLEEDLIVIQQENDSQSLKLQAVLNIVQGLKGPSVGPHLVTTPG